MVAKTLKMPASLSARIERKARAAKRPASVIMREALERGLGEDPGLDMMEALKGIIGSANGPGDLSTNKIYLKNYGRARSG